MNKNYTVYHLHSDLSSGITNIDSVTKYDEYIDYAASLGMKAIGFSEHGSVFEWVKKKTHTEEKGMKYIHAEEFYITETIEEKIRDNKHCVLIAVNEAGVKELNELSSISFNKEDGHKYYNPRITIDELCNTSDNIIITTACLGGILFSGNDAFRKKYLNFLIANKHRCFLEIQHHNVEEQIKYNQYLYKLHKKYEIPLIAGTDTHALNEEHLKGRSILQKSKGIKFDNEDGWDLTFKTYEELVECYKKQNSLPMDVVLEAIDNTNKMADMIEEFNLDYSYKYPHLWDNPEQLFLNKIQDGIKNRGVDKYPNYQEYLDRINHELEAYRHNGAIDFMLLMEDIISWCNKHDIKVGYGRGSVNGSVIAWLLGITEMDSIKHKLNFERFMNTERVSLSDIDTDFPPSRIDEVKQYIFSRHGLYCCDIVTFNTIAMKGAIRDVCRGLYKEQDLKLSPKLQKKYDEWNELSKHYNGQGQSIDMPEELKREIDKFNKGYLKIAEDIIALVEVDENKAREEYQEVFKYVDIVNGAIVSVGSHPCGCVVSPHNVSDAFGTFTTSTSEYPISQIYMKEIDSLNYVKLDLLRLDTIELINNTCKLANIERLTPDNIDITDINVWNSMRDDTTQIFQWEGRTGDDYIKKLLSDENIKKFQEVDDNVDRMTLLSIGNSAIRPAGASYREDLANGVVRKSGSDVIDEFLKPTFGYLVFQCQIIDFLHQYCGFTMGEADIVRRHFSKKQFTPDGIAMTELDTPVIKDGGYMTDINGEQKKDHYIKGFVATMQDKYGMNKEDAEEAIVAFLQVIIDASRYLFSLNHSQPYSYEGYASAWLRYYYPVEFLTCALNINKDKEEKTLGITEYAKKVGIKIEPIKFRYSNADYSCDKNTKKIYKGIQSIKFLNANIANELYELKDEHFNTFVDLLFKMKELSINSKQLNILIQLDFFSEFGDINKLLKITELFDLFYGKKQIKKDKILELGLDEEMVRKNSKEESATRVEDLDYQKYITINKISTSDLNDCIKYKYVTINEKKQKEPNGYSFKKFVKKFNISTNEQLKYATKIVVGKFSDINLLALLTDVFNSLKIKECSIIQKMEYQVMHLGYIDTVLPKFQSNYYFITKIDGKWSNKMVSLYQLNSGKTFVVKVKGKTLEENPLTENIIIKVIITAEEQKWGRKDGQYYKKDEYETILKKYSFVR